MPTIFSTRVFIRTFLRSVYRSLRKIYSHWIHKQENYIFVHTGPFAPEQREDCRICRYSSIEAVPQTIWNTIVTRQGQGALEHDLQEIRDKSTLWVAFVDSQVASIWHSRRGEFFRRWFVPLKPNDLVIFRGRTYPEFRGRGISPSIMQFIMANELTMGDSAFVDCSIHNKASKRSIEKSGFRILKIARPITREWAIHSDETVQT